MFRLLLWLVRVIIVGRPLRLRPPCVRGCNALPWTTRAAVYCQHQLCVRCCEVRCRCLALQIQESAASRQELAS